MSKKLFIVTAVDTSETAAGMEQLVVDFDKWSAHTKDYSYGCEWKTSMNMILKSRRTDNGQHSRIQPCCT